MGRFHLGWAISAIIGPVVGGYLAFMFPSYRPIFLLALVVSFLSVVAVFVYTGDDRGPGCPNGLSAELVKIFRELPSTVLGLLRHRKVAAASLAVFAHSLSNWGLGVYFPLLAHDAGANELLIGASLTVNALLMAVALPMIGRYSDRLGRSTPIVAGLALDAVVFALLPLSPSPWLFPLILALKGVGSTLVFPVSQAATLEAIPLGERGVGTGLWGTTMSLGATVGMLAMTVVVSVTPVGWVFFISSMFSVAGSIALFALRRYFD